MALQWCTLGPNATMHCVLAKALETMSSLMKIQARKAAYSSLYQLFALLKTLASGSLDIALVV